MQKTIVICLVLIGALYGEKISPAEEIYQQKCATCHTKLTTKKEALKKIKTLKAPPMREVAKRLKEMIQINGENNTTKLHRGVVVAFIKDYVYNPHIDKSLCHANAIDRFEVMPSLKGKISEEELQIVAEWIYDNFKTANTK